MSNGLLLSLEVAPGYQGSSLEAKGSAPSGAVTPPLWNVAVAMMLSGRPARDSRRFRVSMLSDDRPIPLSD
ncbi:hypothetical protein EYF80_025340 [Liparis tanakae]|uniref:Uncharacterized protein n=1 Tax=Liparis tanakae TaxID=230148 RepID=A0A4Z2HFT0_9TELE|nr:hypothetical protein EYF80_025340 [Liparis tanakae]